MRLVPGMPLQRSLRAVVVWSDEPMPGLALRRLHDGVVVPVALAPTPMSPRLAAALARRKVGVGSVRVEGLEPETLYQWESASAAPTVVRTLPARVPREGLSFLVASCFYGYFPGNATRGVAAAQSVIAREHPAFRLLIGDNVYLDVAPDQRRFSDAYEETAERYVHYLTARGCGEWFGAIGSGVTWDDHEFWNDYPERQAFLSRTSDDASPGGGTQYATYRDAADEAISVFQQPLNPPGVAPGSRSYSFDVDPVTFFVADTRSRRTLAADPSPRLLPEADLAAMERWAEGLDERRYGVFVMGQPLWMPPEYRELLGAIIADHNPPAFRAQYARIVAALARAGTDVLVVSGDVHFSRLASFAVGAGRRVYELVTSPFCEIPTLGSALGSVLGADASQDVTNPEAPSQLPVPSPAPPDWYFGTRASNSFASVRLAEQGGTVAVTARFVDAFDPAGKSAPAAPPGASVRAVLHGPLCEGDGRPLFTLHSR